MARPPSKSSVNIGQLFTPTFFSSLILCYKMSRMGKNLVHLFLLPNNFLKNCSGSSLTIRFLCIFLCFLKRKPRVK